MILRQSLLVSGIGVAAGLALGVAGTAIFRSQLYGIGAVEWMVLAPAGSAMVLVSALVAYVSARPWITVDPMDAVRHV